jgi:uncharacterized membrane protein (UPF0127 family)
MRRATPLQPLRNRPSFRGVKRHVTLAVTFVLVACGKDHAPTQVVTTPPDTVATSTAVVFGADTVLAKIAATAGARDTGLMNVTSLATNAGMLFVFADSTTSGFWMEDTPLPLSIAFIDANMTVVNTDDMTPETLTPHYPARAYKFALEVNEGWFASHGVMAGSVVKFTIPAGTVTDP